MGTSVCCGFCGLVGLYNIAYLWLDVLAWGFGLSLRLELVLVLLGDCHWWVCFVVVVGL